MKGCTFNYWEWGTLDKLDFYDDRFNYILIDNDFIKDENNFDGCHFVASFSGTPTYTKNSISISNVSYASGALSATVISTYVTDVDLEIDFSAIYDYSELISIDPDRWDTKTNISESKIFNLTKGQKTWNILLNFRYGPGSGTGVYDSVIDNIRWEFSGNNGTDGNGVVLGNYLYYYINQSGKLR